MTSAICSSVDGHLWKCVGLTKNSEGMGSTYHFQAVLMSASERERLNKSIFPAGESLYTSKKEMLDKFSIKAIEHLLVKLGFKFKDNQVDFPDAEMLMERWSTQFALWPPLKIVQVNEIISDQEFIQRNSEGWIVLGNPSHDYWFHIIPHIARLFQYNVNYSKPNVNQEVWGCNSKEYCRVTSGFEKDLRTILNIVEEAKKKNLTPQESKNLEHIITLCSVFVDTYTSVYVWQDFAAFVGEGAIFRFLNSLDEINSPFLRGPWKDYLKKKFAIEDDIAFYNHIIKLMNLWHEIKNNQNSLTKLFPEMLALVSFSLTIFQ